MKTLTFLLSKIIELYTIIFLLHIWMYWTRCDFYNSFSQFIMKIIQPVIRLMSRFISMREYNDTSSLLVAFILSFVKAILFFKKITFYPIIWIASVLILVKTIGLLVFWMLLAMIIISFTNQKHEYIENILMQLIDPILRPIRNLLPSINIIDFSSMTLSILLYVMNMGIEEILQSSENVLLLRIWLSI